MIDIDALFFGFMREMDARRERVCRAAVMCGYCALRLENQTYGATEDHPDRLLDGCDNEIARWWIEWPTPESEAKLVTFRVLVTAPDVAAALRQV